MFAHELHTWVVQTLWEKDPLPHRGPKPTSVSHLAFQWDALPTDLSPFHTETQGSCLMCKGGGGHFFLFKLKCACLYVVLHLGYVITSVMLWSDVTFFLSSPHLCPGMICMVDWMLRSNCLPAAHWKVSLVSEMAAAICQFRFHNWEDTPCICVPFC